MGRQISFTHIEQAILPGFRERMSRAESAEEAKQFFAETVASLLSDVMDDPRAVQWDDVTLTPGQGDGYALGDRVRTSQAFLAVWEGSDLPRILGQFARDAANRCAHLDKNPLRTEAKIFHHKQGKR